MTRPQRTVVTPAGVTLGAEVYGDGAAALLVHGVSSGRRRWMPAVEALLPSRAWWQMDRRGRGISGDGESYSLEAEVADIVAVAQAAQAREIVAHSYGAILALEAALHLPALQSLVLYEPPIPLPPYPADEADERNIAAITAAIAAEQAEQAVTVFVRDVLKMPAPAIEALQGGPGWAMRVALAHTLPRELQAARAYRFDAAAFAGLEIPVLLLLGGDSAPRYAAAAELVAGALPNVSVGYLPGQRHNAITEAPELFASAVNEFLTGQERA